MANANHSRLDDIPWTLNPPVIGGYISC